MPLEKYQEVEKINGKVSGFFADHIIIINYKIKIIFLYKRT